jgi:hypothetical protein
MRRKPVFIFASELFSESILERKNGLLNCLKLTKKYVSIPLLLGTNPRQTSRIKGDANFIVAIMNDPSHFVSKAI